MVKPARTNQFHSELEFLWGKLAEDILKHKSGKVGYSRTSLSENAPYSAVMIGRLTCSAW